MRVLLIWHAHTTINLLPVHSNRGVQSYRQTGNPHYRVTHQHVTQSVTHHSYRHTNPTCRPQKPTDFPLLPSRFVRSTRRDPWGTHLLPPGPAGRRNAVRVAPHPRSVVALASCSPAFHRPTGGPEQRSPQRAPVPSKADEEIDMDGYVWRGGIRREALKVGADMDAVI
jgi:hypothetical protein